MVLNLLGITLITLLFKSTEAWFESCDHTVSLPPNGSIYINSPYYPNRYPSRSSCRYEIVAPLDYEINIQCNIALDKPTSSCGTEFFYIATDGNKALTGSEYFCGEGYFQRKSLFTRMVIAYTSSSTSTAGAFSCLATASPQPCDCGWSVRTRITGGVETQVNEFPFIVALVYIPTNELFCAGTIISHRHVISATHCIRVHGVASQLLIVAGEHDLKTNAESPYTMTYNVQSIKSHEQYNPSTDHNDIAILTTTTNIEWSRGVGPACLPILYSYAQFDGMQADIAGWGTTSFAGPPSTVLLKATVGVTTNSACQSSFPNLSPTQLCTYSPPKDSCQYDSGGPVIIRFSRMFLVGIISLGNACGYSTPAVNTRITSYLNWIQTNTGVSYCRKS